MYEGYNKSVDRLRSLLFVCKSAYMEPKWQIAATSEVQVGSLAKLRFPRLRLKGVLLQFKSPDSLPFHMFVFMLEKYTLSLKGYDTITLIFGKPSFVAVNGLELGYCICLSLALCNHSSL